jgi:hypothetical protein
MKRTLSKLFLVAASVLALAACETNPAKPEPVAPAPAAKKTLVEMEYELRKLEIEGQNAREERSQIALIKFAADADNDFAKGVGAGLLGGGQKQASAPEPSRRSMLDSVTQAEAIELRKLELQDKNSWWNRGLQVTDRVLGFKMFSKGLDQERYRIDQSNSQQRYLFGTLRGTQQDAYGFSTTVLEHGPYVLPAGATAAPAAPSTPAPPE